MSSPCDAQETSLTVDTRPLVLVVDDDDAIREALTDLLDAAGFDAVTARDGLDALKLLAALPTAPAFILLDLMMPVMDGWQFRKEQKQDMEIAGIPLVVITATGKRPVLIDAAELVMKPLDLTQLFAAIERYCH